MHTPTANDPSGQGLDDFAPFRRSRAEERRELERERRRRAKVAEDRRVAFMTGLIVVPFIAVVSSGLIWLTAQIWIHMPW